MARENFPWPYLYMKPGLQCPRDVKVYLLSSNTSQICYGDECATRQHTNEKKTRLSQRSFTTRPACQCGNCVHSSRHSQFEGLRCLHCCIPPFWVNLLGLACPNSSWLSQAVRKVPYANANGLEVCNSSPQEALMPAPGLHQVPSTSFHPATPANSRRLLGAMRTWRFMGR